MLTGKRFSTITLFVSVLIISSIPVYANKSVYVINNTLTSQLQAYRIEGSTLVYQTDYTCLLDPLGEYGAIGITIDESGYGQFLFVSFEFSDEIELINAKTMQYVDMVMAPGADNLAGIVMDTNNNNLYAVDRYRDRLYSWSWNPETVSLTPNFSYPYYIQLVDCYEAFGIALDEENNRLYVADHTDSIKYYSTTNWSNPQPLLGEITASCNVISIAIDVNNQILYYGSVGWYGDEDTHLYKYNIYTQSEDDPVDVGCSVAGIAVDQKTSLVYITTFGSQDDIPYEDPPQDRLMVYNSSLQRLWYSDDIGNPAGVAVAANVGYKEPAFSIVKDNNDPNNDCVNTSDYLTFDIVWDANNHSDTNVYLIDYLPADVEYYSSQPQADDYNSTYHKVTWNLGNLNGTESGSFQITTQVKSTITCPCGRLTNTVYLESDNYCSTTAIDVNICSWSYVLYVDKDSSETGNGTSWDSAFNELTDALQIAKKCSGSYDQIWVAEGTYKPVYNTAGNYQNHSFEVVSNVSLLGHFAGNETSPYQRDLADANNETILEGQIGETYQRVNKIVTAEGIDGSLIDGFTIKSADDYGLYINDSNLAIINCELWYNSNGIYCENSSELDIHNCLFSDNSFGLSVYNNDSNTIVSSCIFVGDEIESYYGAIIENSTVEFDDCNFQEYFSDAGINCSGGSLTVKNCNVETSSDYSIYGIYALNCDLVIEEHTIISNSNGDGLYVSRNSDSNLTLKESIFRNNSGNGIKFGLGNYPGTIINNWIHDNTASGISFTNPMSYLTIRNNTIYKNSSYGISGGGASQIRNCIIYYNSPGKLNGNFTNVSYCYMDDPDFMNIETDPNDLHISADSPCIDKGDSNDISDTEIDIDGEGRIQYGEVDMGGDEYYISPADFDSNGIVNFIDYAILANAFDDYVEKCDLDCNDCINLADLELFCEDWLWEAPWNFGGEEMMMCMGGGDGRGGGLMLDTEQSLIARPQRLAEQEPVYIDENVIYEALKWLDELWLSEDMEDSLTEEQYLMIRKLFEEELSIYLKGD